MYRTVSASALRNNQKEEFDKVCDNHEALIATRQNGENVVILSETDYLALNETAYLLRSQKNRTRLIAALKNKGRRFDRIQDMEKYLGI